MFSKVPKAQPIMIPQAIKLPKDIFLNGRKKPDVIFNDSSINPLNMNVITKTDRRFSAVKIGNFIKKNWITVTGIIAKSPRKIDKRKWSTESFFIQSKKTIDNKNKGTKHIPIDAKRFINTSYIRFQNFVRYFYDYFVRN